MIASMFRSTRRTCVRARHTRIPRSLFGVLVAGLTLAAAPRAARAQDNSVSGRVVAAGTNEGLAGAQITVSGGTQRAASDAEGRFRITGPDRDRRPARRASHRLSHRPSPGARRPDESHRLAHRATRRASKRSVVTGTVGRHAEARDRQRDRHDQRIRRRRDGARHQHAGLAQRAVAEHRRHADVGTGRHRLADSHSRTSQPLTRKLSAHLRRRRPRQQRPGDRSGEPGVWLVADLAFERLQS